ncbi:MAG: glycosyl transferase [Okeania sp. SIO2H7]|nr:glycosyl transferase [Okeania sp. SIO2H7]
MSRPTIYVAVTNHGFGHAVRASSVVDRIQQLCPDVLIIMVTTAPRWLLESYIDGDFIQRQRAFDVGVIQSDSLTMDREATLVKLNEIRAKENSIIASEVNFIRQNKVDLVLADIPPLAARIAKNAGVPCWMFSNFGWDFIYRPWGGDFVEIADWIAGCFEECDRLFRLPLHEEMSAFPNIEDVGLTGGTPRYEGEELKEYFGIKTPPEKTITLSFGGLGLAKVPYQNVELFPDWQFITFDTNIPEFPNLINVKNHPIKITPKNSPENNPSVKSKTSSSSSPLSKGGGGGISVAKRIRPVDLMPICGRIVSKPGYSTFAEALRLGTPIVSLSREGFAESAFLLEGIQNYSYHQILMPEVFFNGEWEFLRKPLAPPKKSEQLDKNGSEAIARAAVKYLQSKQY